VLKNTRYLTSAKGLLSPGFYSSSLLNRNVWASKTFSKGAISDISGIRDVLYGDFSGLCVKNTSTLAPGRFFYNVSRSTSLGFYEFGYYWFTQRFYQLNNLHSSAVSSVVGLAKLTSSSSWPARPYPTGHLSELTSFFGFEASLALGFGNFSWNYSAPLSRNSVGSHYLNYVDRALLTRVRVEQISNLAKTNLRGPVPLYTPAGARVANIRR
jgi:hypothetical protein